MTNRHINLLLPFAALLWIGFFYGCRAAQPAEPDVRVMRYYPDGRDFVCLNGEGRYNRPLNGPVWGRLKYVGKIIIFHSEINCGNVIFCVY